MIEVGQILKNREGEKVEIIYDLKNPGESEYNLIGIKKFPNGVTTFETYTNEGKHTNWEDSEEDLVIPVVLKVGDIVGYYGENDKEAEFCVLITKTFDGSCFSGIVVEGNTYGLGYDSDVWTTDLDGNSEWKKLALILPKL